MFDAASAVMRWIGGIDQAAFLSDEILQSAVMYRIQIIGEAASRISREFRAEHPEIPWRRIVAMRQVLVHDYMHIDPTIVWEVATEHLPPLVEALEPLAPPIDDE